VEFKLNEIVWTNEDIVCPDKITMVKQGTAVVIRAIDRKRETLALRVDEIYFVANMTQVRKVRGKQANK
jgi:hypothetical protein